MYVAMIGSFGALVVAPAVTGKVELTPANLTPIGLAVVAIPLGTWAYVDTLRHIARSPL